MLTACAKRLAVRASFPSLFNAATSVICSTASAVAVGVLLGRDEVEVEINVGIADGATATMGVRGTMVGPALPERSATLVRLAKTVCLGG